MKRIILACLLAVGCTPKPLEVSPEGAIARVHDDAARVTCWRTTHPYGVALSCLPDAQVAPGVGGRP
jgi:hypothetical protein